MIKIKMSAQQTSMRDWFLRKIKKGSNTAAGKAAEVLASIIRTNIRSGYELLLGGEKWTPISDMWLKQVGYDPGQYRSGDLLRSVRVNDLGDGTFEVSVDDPKAMILEYGQYHVPPRPFFRPSVHYFEQHGIAETVLIEEMTGDGA